MDNYLSEGVSLKKYIAEHTGLSGKIAMIGSDVRKFMASRSEAFFVAYDGDSSYGGARIPSQINQKWIATIAIVGESDAEELINAAGIAIAKLLDAMRDYPRPFKMIIDQSIKPYYNDGTGYFPVAFEISLGCMRC